MYTLNPSSVAQPLRLNPSLTATNVLCADLGRMDSQILRRVSMFRTAPLIFLLLSIAALLEVQADEADDQLSAARTHWLRGRYEEASDGFESLLPHGQLGARAAVGLSRCKESVGKWSDASEVIDSAIEKFPADADL